MSLKGKKVFNFFNKKLPSDFDQVQKKGRKISKFFFKPNQELQQDFNLIDKVNKSKFEDFRFRDEEKIGEVFDRENSFKTSVRGVKVRGVFDTKREADVRAAVLQRLDPLFDVFVGQVGYWCPWDPNPQKIDDIEYLNQDLNKLVKEYKANEAKKDQFYNEQKTQRQKVDGKLIMGVNTLLPVLVELLQVVERIC